jgi:hypothetical protein
MEKYILAKKDLETFSTKDIKILLKHYNVNSNENDKLLLLSILILNDQSISKKATMAPAKVFEKYGEELFKKISIDNTAQNKDPEAIKLKFIEMDPDKGKNVEWMVISYINNGIKLFEDLGRANSAIKKYNWLVSKKLINSADPANKFLRTLVDFGGLVGYKNTKNQEKVGLETFLNNYKDELIDYEKQFALVESAPNERIVHYNGPNFMLIEPLTEAASCKYGANTRWCTAARENNMFKDYSAKGSLYIIIPKDPKHAGEKYQINIETNSVMDEHDIETSTMYLFQRFPELYDLLLEKIKKNYISEKQENPLSYNIFFPIFVESIKNIDTETNKQLETQVIELIIDENINIDTFLTLENIIITPKILRMLLDYNKDRIILNLIKMGKIDPDIPKKIFDSRIKKDTTILEKYTLALSRYLFADIAIDLLKNVDSNTVEELLIKSRLYMEQKEYILKNLNITISENLLNHLSNITIFNLVNENKIKLDEKYRDRTLLSFLTKFLYIKMFIKRIQPTEKDLLQLGKILQLPELFQLADYYTPEQFTETIKQQPIPYEFYIKDIVNNKKILINDISEYLLSGDINNVDMILDHPDYLDWTMDKNPLFPEKYNINENVFKKVLNNKHSLQFLKKLSVSDIDVLLSKINNVNKLLDFIKYMQNNNINYNLSEKQEKIILVENILSKLKGLIDKEPFTMDEIKLLFDKLKEVEFYTDNVKLNIPKIRLQMLWTQLYGKLYKMPLY